MKAFLFAGGFAYCALYNILDFPAGVVPVTKVTKADIKAAESFPTPYEAERVAKRVRHLHYTVPTFTVNHLSIAGTIR